MSTNKLLKILLVDNSRTIRKSMSKLLKKHGFNVHAVASGNEAINMLKKNTFHLIIMDLYMPTMSGYEATKIIRNMPDENIKNIPIIALTASNNKKDIDISKEAGMDEFVIKTPDQTTLLNILEKYKVYLQ